MASVPAVPITPISPGAMRARRKSAAAASTMCRIGQPASASITSYQPWAVLQGMAIAPQPVRRNPATPRSSQGSGSSPPASFAVVRSGTRGSDHSTAGTWSWSRSAGVSRVSRTMKWALASDPMPPSTPSTRSFRRSIVPPSIVAYPDRCRRCSLAQDRLTAKPDTLAAKPSRDAGRGYVTDMRRTIDLQGHRGARGLFPENTLSGFAAALAIGVDSFELDVAVTADGVPVVSHDAVLNPDLTRGPDGDWVSARGPLIHTLSLAELEAFDVGRIRPGSA